MGKYIILSDEKAKVQQKLNQWNNDYKIDIVGFSTNEKGVSKIITVIIYRQEISL